MYLTNWKWVIMNYKRQLLKEIKELDMLIVRENIKMFGEQFLSNVSLPQVFIIGYLLENKTKEVYQKELEQIFDLRRSTLAGILKTMEKNNIIVRMEAVNDARCKRVVLTDDAITKYNVIVGLIKKQESRLTLGISDEELHTFFKVIDKMKNNLNKEEKC